MAWIPWPEVVLIKSWLDKNTDVHKPDFGRRGWTASNARDKDLCEQGVSPQGVTPQGVWPQGVWPHGVWPQGVSPQGVSPQGVLAAGCVAAGACGRRACPLQEWRRRSTEKPVRGVDHRTPLPCTWRRMISQPRGYPGVLIKRRILMSHKPDFGRRGWTASARDKERIAVRSVVPQVARVLAAGRVRVAARVAATAWKKRKYQKDVRAGKCAVDMLGDLESPQAVKEDWLWRGSRSRRLCRIKVGWIRTETFINQTLGR